MLNFIGIGSAFNTSLGNTSAFIKEKDSLFLIDCGGTVFHRLLELSLLQNIQNIYICITHTHPDHVGSLGEVIFYAYYILKRKPIIYYPQREWLENTLKYLGVSPELYRLEDGENVSFEDTHLGKWEITYQPTLHMKTLPAYNMLIKGGGMSTYYSGDGYAISDYILEKLQKGEIDRLYQDTCGAEYEGNVHMPIRALAERIPQALRHKVYCMHLDEVFSREQAEALGFNVVTRYAESCK